MASKQAALIVIIIFTMSIKCFKVRYFLQYLQARSAPLFSNVRAYLINDLGKRLIAEINSAKDKKIVFQAYLDEERCKIVYNNQEKKYENKNITILFEFGADEKFIKMGQVHINIVELINSSKNGQVLPYKIEKCYDRNARIFLGITFISMKPNQQRQQKSQQISHSRSQCVIPPPRIKMRTTHEKNNFYTTQYSQFTDRQDKQQEMSEVSHKFNLNGARTLNKTQIFKKNPNVITHSQQIIDLKTQNRIYQHQIAQIELRQREMIEETQYLKEFINKYKNQKSELVAELEDVKKELYEKDNARQTLREQLNADMARTLKLYQESEQQRNKLLIQRDREASQEKNHIKDLQKKILEQRNKIKNLQKNEQGLRRKIQQYMSQIAIYQKALKSEQKSKQKIIQQLQSNQKQVEIFEVDIANLKECMQRLKRQKQQSQSELQISHFSLQQLKKQVLQLKRYNKQLIQQISKYETELKATAQVIKLQRSNYTRKLQQIKHQAQIQQQNRQAYLEELQVKTINQFSKNNHITLLKKEISKLKHELVDKREKMDQLQSKISDARSIRNQLQIKIQEYQHKMVQLSRENALLENQLISFQESHNLQASNVSQKRFNQKQRQDLIALCYQQRDDFWKKQIQQIQKDTKLLIEKIKKQKQENWQKLKKSNEDYTICQQNLRRTKKEIKDLLQQQQKMQNSNKYMQNKLLELEKQKNGVLVQNQKYQIRIKQLQKKLLVMQELEDTFAKSEQNIARLKIEVETMKNDLQKQKIKNKKIRSEVKELVNITCSYMGKSQKQRIFYDELRCEFLDTQILLSFNSAAKLFCDKHNKLRTKLQQLQDVKRQLQQKDQQCQRANKSLREQRKSRGSCDSHSSFNQSMVQSTTQFIAPIRNPLSRVTTQKDQYEVRTLKLDIEELKGKLKRQSNRYNQLEKEATKLKQQLEQKQTIINRIKDQSQENQEKIVEVKEKLKIKEKQLQSTKEQLKQMGDQLYNLKKQLEQSNRTLKQQKSQQILKRTTVRPFNSHQKGMDESFLKTFELQKRLKATQEELQRLKRQAHSEKNDSSHTRQLKALQSRIKQKQQIIMGLRENIDQERQKNQQLKELNLLKIRKLKQQFQEQMEAKNKLQKQLTQSLAENQQKLRQTQKRLKISQQNLKNANSQLANFSEKEQKGKKMILSQFQLKIKLMQGDYETQLINMNKKIDQYKLLDRTAKEGDRRKEREIVELKIDLEKSQRTIGELTQKLQLCGVRLKNMQQQQCNFKGVIEALQSKIKIETTQQRKNQQQCEKQGFDSRSNFSIKTFTFR